ncbi:MAG TPA: M12 family metallo-peptidase [Baekduia sp.]
MALVVAAGLVGSAGAFAAAPAASVGASAAASAAAWSRGGATARRSPAVPTVAPADYAAFTLDQGALAAVLAHAPAESLRGGSTARRAAAAPSLTISIPAPDGTLQRFAIADSPVMEPGLAAAHPEIRTYAGRGIDDPTADVRLDLTPLGFHASVRSDRGAWFVDPHFADRSEYVSYDRSALPADPDRAFVEHDDGHDAPTLAPAPAPHAGEVNGAPVTLRTYRLALITDPTYAAYAGGDTTAAKVVLMNRVDQLYESDFAIRMVLIDDNDKLNLDTTAQMTGADGPCGPDACYSMAQAASCTTDTLTRNRTVAGLLAGADHYDIAHLAMGNTGGGIAGVRVVGGADKAAGCTAITTPVGDAFAVDYVAHEMGHQFGGDHTFNGTQTNCAGGNRASGLTTVEPGSGSSVMAYAGICGQDDLQAHTDPYFSQASIAEISSAVTSGPARLSAQQQAVLTGFSGSDTFRITYGGQVSAPIGAGAFTPAGIAAAIEGIAGWPAGATATVTLTGDGGFLVAFGGTLANVAVSDLGLTDFTGSPPPSGYVGTIVAGGLTTQGGSTITPTGNHAPAVTATASHTIPVRTPFTLDATGSDADGDPLTYLWEQNDPGESTTGTGLVDNTKTDGPLFREFGTAARYASPGDALLSPSPGENVATAMSSRSFPDVAQVMADHTNALIGACPAAAAGTVPAATVDCFSEFLPTADWVGRDGDRTLHFRVTARDNHPGAGGTGSADTALTLAPGPFRLTSQGAAATIVGTDPVTDVATLHVVWSVAGTAAAPVSAPAVKISLSVDGGATFSKVLAASTPNDGDETVDLPRVATAHGRVKIEATNNVFFDVSRGELTITQPGVVVNGPPAVQLGSAAQDVVISNDGDTDATLGAVAVTGADAGAVRVVADGCSSAVLAARATCTVTLALTPVDAGAQAAVLTVPSDDPRSPVRVALTGAGTGMVIEPPPTDAEPNPDPGPPAVTAPAPVVAPVVPQPAPPSVFVAPSAAARADALASRALGIRSPRLLGTAGHVRLYATTASTKLGRPTASRRLAVAVCAGGPCSATVTTRLQLNGHHTNRTLPRATLKLRDGQLHTITLHLRTTLRHTIATAHTAKLQLALASGATHLRKTYTFTTR